MKLSEELAWRGFNYQTTYKDLSSLDDQPITFYWGVDPSADSMTIGNFAAAMMVKTFARHGHKPVLLIGGAYGVTDNVKKRANQCWSLSNLVFPHQMVRLILAEQVYRAFSILNNSPYHHV